MPMLCVDAVCWVLCSALTKLHSLFIQNTKPSYKCSSHLSIDEQRKEWKSLIIKFLTVYRPNAAIYQFISLLYSPKYKLAMGRYREQVIVLDKHPWWHSFLERHANEINIDSSSINKYPSLASSLCEDLSREQQNKLCINQSFFREYTVLKY